MARTAHHVSYASDWTGRPWREVILYDLRYSAACLATQGSRPQPKKIRRAVAIYSFPRAFNGDRDVAKLAKIAERRARRRLRRELWRGDDPVPARHRHWAVYHAW